jgi:hypothetical protein
MKPFTTHLKNEGVCHHSAHVAEIVHFEDTLTLAEPFIEKLETHPEIDLRLYTSLEASNTPELIALCLTANHFTLHGQQMHDALISLGFIEVARITYGKFDDVTLSKDARLIAVASTPCKRQAPSSHTTAQQSRHHYDQVPT